MSLNYDDLRDPRDLFAEPERVRLTGQAIRAGGARRLAEAALDGLEDGLTTLGFLTPEVETQLDRLEDLIKQVIDDAGSPIVRVKFENYYKAYNYRDPSGSLKVGDRVLVPVGAGGEKVARVTGLGRAPGWTLPVTKSVKARLREEPLS